jgi:general secretion pathway protein D
MTRITFPVTLTALLLCCASCASPEALDFFSDSEDTAQGLGESTPVAESSQDPVLDPSMVQEARGATALRMQKTALLVSEYVSSARSAYADGRALESENYLLEALSLDPGAQSARTLLEQVQIALGRANTAITGSSDDVRLQLVARMERIRAETQAHHQRGTRLRTEGDIEGALGAFHLAQANIDGAPLTLDWNGLDGQIAQSLKSAKADREVAMASQREDELLETWNQLHQEEEARQAREDRRRDLMFTEAVGAFGGGDFDEASRLAGEILLEDPLDAQASEIRDAAFRARHERVSAQFVNERTERFRLWMEDVAKSRIPESEILTDPDPVYWATISESRKHFRDFGAAEEDPEILALKAAITSTKIPGLQFEGETSLEAVVDQLRAYSDIPFVVTPGAIEAVDAEGIEFNLNLSNEITVRNALNVVTEAAGEEVTYTFRNGVVYITTRDKAYGDLILKAHDVNDLTAQLVDFSGPKIASIRLQDDASTLLDDEEPLFGGVAGEPVPIMNPDNLEILITQSIAPQTWEELEGVSIRYSNGSLIVYHTADVQAQIHAFLEDLRQYVSSMVMIESRFLTIRKDFLQEIGVDFRGLGGFPPANTLVNLDDITSGQEDNASAGLDNEGPGHPAGADTNPSAGAFFDEGLDGDIRARTENILGSYGDRITPFGGATFQFAFLDDTQTSIIMRAVKKSEHAEQINASSISAQNTQRAYITVLNQVTYVQDFDVEVAAAALIADPQVGVLSDGIVLDVRPTIGHNRKYITLELRPTIATLRRPIPEFTSSLAGLTTPVTLQLPELNVASANTTVVVPDGGTVVVGGLQKLFNIDQRSEIPFLGKIPLLSWLFKAEGEAEENQDIIILIRAHIVDAREVIDRLDA